MSSPAVRSRRRAELLQGRGGRAADGRVPVLQQLLQGRHGLAGVRAHLPQPAHYYVLGTDGFGRSDTRRALRGFFEVDRRYVAVTALKALADQEALPQRKVKEAMQRYAIDPDKPNPATV